MDGHTPTPWELYHAPTGEWTVKAVYRDAGLRHTCWPVVCHAGGQPNKANATFIVEACNSYDANRSRIAALEAENEVIKD